MMSNPESNKDNQLDELTNVVGSDLDESANGDSLADAANYSRFYFQRMFREQMGETPSNCRRRLLLERAGHQLLHTQRAITDLAFDAGFDSLEGFSRAFRRGYAVSPSHFRRIAPLSWFLATPNDIHYDPVVGAAVRLTDVRTKGGNMDLTDRLIEHDLWETRRLLEAAGTLSDQQLDAPLIKQENPLPFESPEKTLRDVLNRIVFTKEVWMAAVHGRRMAEEADESVPGMLKRMESSFGEYLALVQRVREDDMWDSNFIDMLCEPPETFTYGGMIAHNVTYSAYRRLVALHALQRFGIKNLMFGDPMAYEQSLA